MARRFIHRRPARTPGRKGGFSLRNWKTAAALGTLVLLCGAGYVAQVNATASRSYSIRTLENEIAGLKEQKEKLELKVAAEQSVQTVDRKVKEMGMVPTPKVEYVMAAAPVVAKR